jgi:hypothetical protein
MARKKSAFDKRIVICGVLVALSVIILYLGCAIEVLDLTLSAVVALLVVVIVIEMGHRYAWLAYVATSILSLIMLPQKTPAIFYACFMGFYPIIKSYVERLSSTVLQWVIKIAVGNAALVLMLLIIRVFVPDEFETGLILISTYALGMIAFVMYDVALSKLITAYFVKFRDRIKIYKFLK